MVPWKFNFDSYRYGGRFGHGLLGVHVLIVMGLGGREGEGARVSPYKPLIRAYLGQIGVLHDIARRVSKSRPWSARLHYEARFGGCAIPPKSPARGCSGVMILAVFGAYQSREMGLFPFKPPLRG